jgi:hypothetical protein
MFTVGWETLRSESMLLVFLGGGGVGDIPDSALIMHLTIPYYRSILRLKTASSQRCLKSLSPQARRS